MGNSKNISMLKTRNRASLFHRGISLGLTGILLCAVFATVMFPNTALAEEKIIRVGRYDYPGMMDEDADGDYSGYAIDYIDEMAKYTDWNYEYVYDDWDVLLEKLENGEIDLICTAQYSTERDEVFDYADEPLGYESSKLYCNIDDDRFYYNDFAAFNGMTVGVLQGNYLNEVLENYATQHGFTFKFKYYDTNTECFQALDRKEIDAAFNGGMEERVGYKVLSDVSSDAFYIIVKDGNSQLLSEVNAAMTDIRISNPYIKEELYDKYFGNTEQDKTPSFTREEVEYIASAGTITVGNQANRFPICDVDEKGNLYGIQIDLLDAVSKMSGLTFENELCDSSVRAVDYMNEPGLRIFNGLPRSDFATFSPDIILSDPMFTDSISFVAKKGSQLYTDDKIRIVIPDGFVSGKKLLNKLYPNATVIFGGTKQDCLDALLDGTADFSLMDNYMSSALLQKPCYESLTTLSSSSIRQDWELAVLKSEDPRLLSIINKCLDCIGDNTKTNLVTKYTVTSQYQLSFTDYLYKYRIWFSCIVLLVLCLIVALITVLAVRMRSAAKLKISNENLSEAIEKVNDANRAKNDFLARMSHDMRTPMNGILGLTALSKDETDVNVLKENMSKIDQSGNYLLGLINDTLDFQKIESGHLTLEPQVVSTHKLVNNVLMMVRLEAEKKDIQLNFRNEEADLNTMVRVDPMRVRQIFFNILSNAVKFTQPGGTIEVSFKCTGHTGNIAHDVITITDTGIGMSEDFIVNHIFHPFSQEHSDVVTNYAGSGLGLSIVKKIVELMNGTITVESELGVGTKFTISIDFERVEDLEHINDEQVDERTKDERKALLKKKKILLTEDHPLNAEIAKKLLEKMECIVTWAQDGLEAVKVFEESDLNEFDVILMDIRMPNMDGIEATKTIRSLEREDAQTIPIIAMTANAYEEDVKKSLDAGMNAHIAKPINPTIMIDTIVDCMKREKD